MAQLINANTCFDAWQNVSNIVLTDGSQKNLLITIQTPCNFQNIDNWLKERNPKSFLDNGNNIRHVINTIMPYRFASYFASRSDFYNKYRQVYIKSNNKSWGTYFQRLISYDNHFQLNQHNQLENAINALNGNSPQKNYIVFHLTDIHLGSNVKPMGAPCWHFGEITINADSTINLVAVYRNHDYFNKAFGNFIGLAKLLEFVCVATNRQPGQLIIHSIHAYNGGTKSSFASLIA